MIAPGPCPPRPAPGLAGPNRQPSWLPVSWPRCTGARSVARGQALDVSTHEAYAKFDDNCPVWYHGAGAVAKQFGSLDKGAWLYCFSPTKDGAVFLGGLRLEMWQAFADMMGVWDEWGAADWKDLTIFTEEEMQLKWSPLVFAETQKYTNQELVNMSIEYGKSGRLAPIAPVVAPVCTPLETME